MECQYHSFIDSPHYPVCTEMPMSPESKHPLSPTHPSGQWDFSRYPSDSKPSFLSCLTVDSVTSALVPPFAIGPLPRPGSPTCTNLSSTCSTSRLSPSMDTDYYPVLSPPALSDTPLSQYDTCSQFHGFTNLTKDCVNLGDVNPAPDHLLGCYDDNFSGFNLTGRACSMSSDDSRAHGQFWSEDGVPHYPRTLSPDSLGVKEEIQVPDVLNDIDPIQDEDLDLINDAQSPRLKIEADESTEDKDDDDDEYKPNKKVKGTSAKSARISKVSKRRTASQLSTHAKRAKFGREDAVVARPNLRTSIQGSNVQYSCPNCRQVTFTDQSGLDGHIKKKHTRPFTCIFAFAGCSSTFPNKNEWKRHCTSQHIMLQYWVCQQDACAQVSNRPSGFKKSTNMGRKRNNCLRQQVACPSSLPNGAIFNRKDLYTQHLRRMHVPAHLKDKVRSGAPVPDWDDKQHRCQEEAMKTRCQLPTHMRCPAPTCTARFDGANAWDERMEHVAKHLEKAAAGTEPQMRFDGNSDSTLVEWATDPAIGILKQGENGRWMLLKPLETTGYPAPVVTTPIKDEDDEDADAEGEIDE